MDEENEIVIEEEVNDDMRNEERSEYDERESIAVEMADFSINGEIEFLFSESLNPISKFDLDID